MKKVLSAVALAAALGTPALAGGPPEAAAPAAQIRIIEGRLIDPPVLRAGVPTRLIFANDSQAAGQILLGKALHGVDASESGASSPRSFIPLAVGATGEVVVVPDHAGHLPVTLVGFGWLPGAPVQATYLEADGVGQAGQDVATLPSR